MTPGWRIALLWAALAAPVPALAVPGDILFSDNFERNNLAPWTTTNAARSGIIAGGAVSNSPTRGAFTRRQVVTITSPTFGAAVPSADISFWIRHGSDAFSEYPDANEDLVIEYRRADSSWAQLAIYRGGGTAGQIFTDTFILPPDALHGALAIRARQTGGSNGNFDWWHIDDILVTEIVPPGTLAIGSCDDFESGLVGNWTVTEVSGLAGTSTATSQSPNFAMTLNGGVVDVASNTIDTTDTVVSATYPCGFAVALMRSASTPTLAKNLVVEYLDDANSWQSYSKPWAAAAQPGRCSLRNLHDTGKQDAMPASGLRLRQTGRVRGSMGLLAR